MGEKRVGGRGDGFNFSWFGADEDEENEDPIFS
jgi:hypothetical protein